MTRIRPTTQVLGALLLVLCFCWSPAQATPARGRAARTVTITIKQGGVLSGFAPRRLTITHGTKVVVANNDSMAHTMTSVAKDKRGNPLFDTRLAAHSRTTVKAVSSLAAGTYHYYCQIHPNMRGTLIIKGGTGGTKPSGPTFTLPLLVPKQLTGRTVHVPVTYARVRMLPTGPTTPMWTFDGTYPGPTIRETAGHATTVVYRDELKPATGMISIHLHGDHHASADDGQPAPTTGTQTNALLAPGHSLAYHYSLTDSADPGRGGFEFYHDHTMGETARNNWNGLQGMFVVDSPAEKKLHLPSGKYDVPLMVSDRSFTKNNQLVPFAKTGTPPSDTTVGTHILVNGRYLPHLDVATHRYRLRLLNASDYQSYDFALTGGMTFRQIGTGDGLLPRAVTRSDIILGPAQRAEVIVDFAGHLHRDVVLRSVPCTDHAKGAIGTPSAPIMQFRVTKKLRDASVNPSNLLPVPKLTLPTTVAQTWDFGLGDPDAHGMRQWTVNGQAYDPSVVMLEVPQGTTQRWLLRNDTDVTHYIHLHEEEWHTIARFDASGRRHAPPPWEDGLEDTWRIDPGAAVEVAAKFTDYPGVFMIHCHMLDHEDDGMMAQFAVVDPASRALPAGYRYEPLSGRHRALTTGTGSMPGMSIPGTPRRHARPRIAQAPVARAATLPQLGRVLGVVAGCSVTIALGLRIRRRRRHPFAR